MRVADAIRSTDALDRIAFWLLPTIATAEAVLVDTSTILAVTIRALQLNGLDTPFECLESHPEHERLGAREVLNRLLAGIRGDAEIVCIVSVSDGGRLIERVGQFLGDVAKGVINVRFVAIYAFGPQPANAEILCPLEVRREIQAAEQCTWCTAESKAIPVDPRLYYPRGMQETQIALRQEHFSDVSEFFERYRGLTGCFTVHREDRNDGRHHAFDIDVKVLMSVRVFQERYRQRLRQIEPLPQLVVTPAHAAGRVLGRIASEVLGIPHMAYDSLYALDSVAAAQRSLLPGASGILVVDDAMISGSRISEYNRAMREHCRSLRAVTFLVGLDRTPTADFWKQERIGLTKHAPWNAQVMAVETFHLPKWDARICPWCHEFDFLAAVARRFPSVPEWLERRLGLLMERERGIREQPFVLLSGCDDPALARGAVAGPKGMSSIETLFAVASGLQRLRNEENEAQRLDPRFPLFSVFGERNVSSNYTEGLMRAAILRTVLRGEWGISPEGNIEKVQEALARDAQKLDQRVMLGEFAVAVARGVFPRRVPPPIEHALQGILGAEFGMFWGCLQNW